MNFDISLDSLYGINKIEVYFTRQYIHHIIFPMIGGFMFGHVTGSVSINKTNDLFFYLNLPILILGALFASLLTGSLVDRFGRKKMIIISCVFCIIGSLITLSPGIAPKYITNVLVGIGIGVICTCCPLYIAEMTPKLIRGRVITLYQVSITFGILLASIVKASICRKDKSYITVLTTPLIPAIIVLIGMLTVSESYRWLLTKNRKDEAKEVIRKLKQLQESSIEEFVKIILEANIVIEEENSQKRFMLFRILRNKIARKSLLFGCYIQIIGQIAGINAILYNSPLLFQYFNNMSYETALWFGSLIYFFNFIPSFVAYKLIDKIGRRKLALISLFGIIFSLVIIAVNLQLVYVRRLKRNQNNNCSNFLSCDDCLNNICEYCQIDENSGYTCVNYGANCTNKGNYSIYNFDNPCTNYINWILLLGMILYVISFAIGMGPIPWVVTSEIYPAWCRSTNMALSTGAMWLCNLIFTLIFFSRIFYAIFWIYCAFTICGIALIYKYFPETNQIDLEKMNYVLF